jgi:hypothetical protein
MARLKFHYTDGDNKWSFENEKKQIVGWLEKVRVGAWEHWCIFLRDGFYLSPGCADEAREFQKKLGGKKILCEHCNKTIEEHFHRHEKQYDEGLRDHYYCSKYGRVQFRNCVLDESEEKQ